ncbi:hypothetical protein GJV07_23750 [Enterobacteriaceae bacterium RIT711]|nr:hypothetical protein [Enterobacteriaceae bacterium RIT711]
MPFVNSIPSSPERPNIISDLNCTSCVAAGAVCLIKYSHNATTSGLASQYARENGVSENSITMGHNAEIQLENIRKFVEKETGYESMVSKWNMDYRAATIWMQSFPIGTVFVVFVDGVLPDHNIKFANHALNAIKTKNIVYLDFQTNRNERTARNRQMTPYLGHTGPSTSEIPFVGVLSQTVATSSQCLQKNIQPSTFDINSVKMKIVAFKRRNITSTYKKTLAKKY